MESTVPFEIQFLYFSFCLSNSAACLSLLCEAINRSLALAVVGGKPFWHRFSSLVELTGGTAKFLELCINTVCFYYCS